MIRAVRSAKNPSASIPPMNIAFFGRSVTPHQSATVMPAVKRPSVSISTLMRRPVKRSGARRYAITQGSWSGAPGAWYFSLAKRSKKSVHSATVWPTRVPMSRKPWMCGAVVSALCVTSSGITVSGTPDRNTMSAASGST